MENEMPSQENGADILDKVKTVDKETMEKLKDEVIALQKAAKSVHAKEWDELTDSEKIERMRQEVKNRFRSLDWMSRRISNLENKINALEEHKHIEGECVIPLRRNGVNGYGEASDSGQLTLVKNYF